MSHVYISNCFSKARFIGASVTADGKQISEMFRHIFVNSVKHYKAKPFIPSQGQIQLKKLRDHHISYCSLDRD